MSLDIYQENILDHYENPKNFGKLKDKDVTAHDSNPLCGDSFDFEFKFENKKIKDVAFQGHGCAISTASASLLSEKIKGKTLDEIKILAKKDVLDLLGVELSHVRIKCAMLPLKIIKLGIYGFLDKK